MDNFQKWNYNDFHIIIGKKICGFRFIRSNKIFVYLVLKHQIMVNHIL